MRKTLKRRYAQDGYPTYQARAYRVDRATRYIDGPHYQLELWVDGAWVELNGAVRQTHAELEENCLHDFLWVLPDGRYAYGTFSPILAEAVL